MKECHNSSYGQVFLDLHEKIRDLPAGVVWLPAPTPGRPITQAQVRPEEPTVVNAEMSEAIFGFAGPDDRVVSLNVPALGENGETHPLHTFDIEFDPERPDMLSITLLEVDEDRFIHTVQKSKPFPARLLAELLSRRKATAQEAATWENCSEEEA
jgi:hypothetical protein